MEDELTEEQCAALEAAIVRTRDELQKRLESPGETAPVSLEEPVGRLSRMDLMQAQQMAQAQRRRDQARLQMLQAALLRVRGGTYGECLRCGEPVGYERLRLAPETTLCLACRRETEE